MIRKRRPNGMWIGAKTREATDEEFALATYALEALKIHRNVIALIPAPDPHFASHKIRVVEQRNPQWYIDFGKDFWKSKRSFQLKRWRVIRALERVVRNKVRSNGYEVKLLKLLAERKEELFREF